MAISVDVDERVLAVMARHGATCAHAALKAAVENAREAGHSPVRCYELAPGWAGLYLAEGTCLCLCPDSSTGW